MGHSSRRESEGVEGRDSKQVASDAIGDSPGADDDDDEDGVLGSGSARVAEAAMRSKRPCYPLFIDGIADSVDYFQVRDLFLQHGRLTNVFLQRTRRRGRRFRFGFVRYANKVDAVKAMEVLDGVKLGGAYLSVKPEISAGKMRGNSRKTRRRCSAPVDLLASAKVSHAHGRQLPLRSSPSPRRTWCEVVKGVPMEGFFKCPSMDSDEMLVGVGGCCSYSQRISDIFLFPESDSFGRCEGGGLMRANDDVIFPEMLPCYGRDAFVPLVAVVANASDGGVPPMVEVEEAGWAHAVVPSVTDAACAFLDGVAQMVEHVENLNGCSTDLGIVQEYEAGAAQLNHSREACEVLSPVDQNDTAKEKLVHLHLNLNSTPPVSPSQSCSVIEMARSTAVPTLDEIDMRAGNRRQRAQEVIRSINRSIAASQIANGRGSCSQSGWQ